MFDRLNVCAREFFLEAIKIIQFSGLCTFVQRQQRFDVFVFLTKAFSLLFVGQSHHDLCQQTKILLAGVWTNDLPQCEFLSFLSVFGCVLSSLLIHYNVGSVRLVHCSTIYWLNEISTLVVSLSTAQLLSSRDTEENWHTMRCYLSCVGDKLWTFVLFPFKREANEWLKIRVDETGLLIMIHFFWYEETLDDALRANLSREAARKRIVDKKFFFRFRSAACIVSWMKISVFMSRENRNEMKLLFIASL